MQRTQGCDRFRKRSRVMRGGNGCKPVQSIVLSSHRELQRTHRLALVVNAKAWLVLHPPVAFVAKALELRPAATLKYTSNRRVVCVHDNARTSRQRANQMMELHLDRGEVGKNVRMIEFEIVDDKRAGAVMQELRSLVEKGGVVFVGFQNEVPAAAELSGTAKV